nr:hypothetical protein [Tanacetum cinerariifolium]
MEDLEDDLKDFNDEEMYKAGEEMDDQQPIKEEQQPTEHHSLEPSKEKSPLLQVKHEEVAASYVDLRATVEEYAKENDDNRNQTMTTINTTMVFIEKETMPTIAETNTTTSGNITSLTELLRNANLPKIMTEFNVFRHL